MDIRITIETTFDNGRSALISLTAFLDPTG